MQWWGNIRYIQEAHRKMMWKEYPTWYKNIFILKHKPGREFTPRMPHPVAYYDWMNWKTIVELHKIRCHATIKRGNEWYEAQGWVTRISCGHHTPMLYVDPMMREHIYILENQEETYVNARNHHTRVLYHTKHHTRRKTSAPPQLHR